MFELASTDYSLAFRETLEQLEWPSLCKNLASFASTNKGKDVSENLQLPDNLSESKILLSETLEIGELDNLIDGGLTFSGVYDLETILYRCKKGGIILGDDLLKIANTLSAIRRLRRQINDSQIRPVISRLFIDLVTLPELEKMLRFGLEEGGRIADRASKELALLRQQSQRLILQRKEQLNDILRKNPNIFQDFIIGNRFERPVLAVKLSSSSKLSGIVHDSSSSGNTVFIEPQSVISLGNSIAKLNADIYQEERRLFKEWSFEVAKNFNSLSDISYVLLRLDLALTRARYGDSLKGVAPILDERKDAPFVLKELRHPLLVWKEQFEDGDVVVPVSLEIAPGLKVIAITGPNTGGKTVTLKSVGLAVLMARAGLLIPCSDDVSIPWCDQVLADIGDEQSLQQSLSTFSGHLRRINNILEVLKVSPGPVVVLLDEIGAGTDPSEGTALAIALLKTFADRARLTIATTHFGELKALKYNDSRFENASVAFDSEKIIPTYFLQWGIPGRSNAIAIARRLGLDKLVLQKAEELLLPSKGKEVDQMIIGLEEQRKRQQEAAESAAVLLARTEILHEELLNNWRKQNEYSKEQEKLRQKKLSQTIDLAQKEVRDLISRLRNKDATGETARVIGQKLRNLEQNQSITPSLDPLRIKQWTLKVGDRVRLIPLGKVAEIIEISDDGLHITVNCGSFRSKVDFKDIEGIQGEKPSPPKSIVKVETKSTFTNASVVRTSFNTIDIRGLRVHEAEVVVDEFLRKTAGPVWIVHGIGSGKLKYGLRNWLQTVPNVDRVLDANQDDGGAGCSVVWLV